MNKYLLIAALLGWITLSGCSVTTPRQTTEINIPNTNNVSSNEHMNHGSQWDGSMKHETITSEESFIVNMIPHHQEAIDSAEMILQRWARSELKTLAQAIIDTQTSEITQMEWRLDNRYPNSTMRSTYQTMMPAMHELSGSSLDKVFLEGMIMHHLWAVQMASDVLRVQHRAETMTLAENIIRTQSQEIDMMRNMLKNYQ